MARIVVADNDLDALDLALTDLRLEGHEVHGALDAADAEALVGTVSPDAVVLDYRMPPASPGWSSRSVSWPRIRTCASSSTATTSGWSCGPGRRRSACRSWPTETFVPWGGGAAGVSAQPRVENRWVGPAAILAIALLAAVAVILVAREQVGLEAGREARAAAADAVAPVADAIRTEMSDAASGSAAGSRLVVPTGDTTSAGVPRAMATRARDSGVPVLGDSGNGVVVVATYDTPSVPATVEERRAHVTGLRVVPLDLGSTLNDLQPSRGGISLAGPERVVQALPGPRPSGRAAQYAVKLAPGPAPEWTVTLGQDLLPFRQRRG